MDERVERTMRDIEGSARRAVGAAETTAARAGAYFQGQMGQMSSQAEGLAREANDQIERLTGRSLDAWGDEARDYVRSHPLQAVAITIGIGFVLGKLLRRG